ncbi:hypothetical protein ABZ820_12545 [Streptomyces diacarni]|uniref:hypothetical protein n=1 Tax=Streptomyces diacarni TaxID=2800381 RepID=UPI0033FFA0FA
MNAGEHHHTGPHAPPAPGPALTLMSGGDVREGWCTACKAYSRLTGPVLLLTPGGVATAGTWSWCAICEDPQEAPRA